MGPMELVGKLVEHVPTGRTGRAIEALSDSAVLVKITGGGEEPLDASGLRIVLRTGRRK